MHSFRLADRILAVIAAVALGSAPVQAIPRPVTDAKPRVLMLGDSISMGYHGFVADALAGEATVLRPAENCAGTTKGRRQVDEWLSLDGGDFDVIHFNFGLHDLKRVKSSGENSNDPNDPRQAELDVYGRNLRAIVARLETTEAKLIFATTTPFPSGVKPHRDPEDVARYNEVAVRIMHERGIAINDLYACSLPRLAEIQQPVNVHFTEAGSRALATEVERHIRAVLSAPRDVRVAVCQTLCIDSDVEGNLRRIAYAVEEAAHQNADIACFAEAVVLGWINPAVHELAQPIPGAVSDRIAAMAREHDLMIAIGLSERDGVALYDSAILVDRDGTILLKHRKINTLPELMERPYARGSARAVRAVDTRIGRVGMLICADTFVEENVTAIAAQAPEIVLIPYGWAADPDAWPAHGGSLADWVTSVARRVGCPVVGTDLVGAISAGPWAGKTYGGQSVVADADGRILGVLRDRDPEVRVFEITTGRAPGR